MAVTKKQKKAVKKIVEDGGTQESLGTLMVDSGYSVETAKTPQKLTESKGFKEEMAKYGLTEELISMALVEDIEAKPQNRKPELELGAKILRMTASEGNTNIQVNIANILDKYGK